MMKTKDMKKATLGRKINLENTYEQA